MDDAVAEGQIPHAGGSDQAEPGGTHRRSERAPLHARRLEGEPGPPRRPTAAPPHGVIKPLAGTPDPPDRESDIPPSLPARENTKLTVLVRRWIATVGNHPGDMSAGADPRPTPTARSITDPRGSALSRAGLLGWEASSTPPSPWDGPALADGAVPSALPSNTVPQREEDGVHHDVPVRLAVLIDAQTTTPNNVAALFGVLRGYGAVIVCRAYADWTNRDLRPWFTQLRQHSIQPVHHFATDQHDRTLVALSVDAVDLTRELAVDVMVMVGDLGPALPLVNRLHAAGIRVLGVGPARAPHDLEAACDEYIDLATLADTPSLAPGRHRA
jgi:hypothetical protein